MLGIPNPVPQYCLADEIARNWEILRRLFQARSAAALSTPTLRPKNKRAAGPKRSGDEIPVSRAKVRARGKYLVRADVSEFYRSVYSHAIPWAVHGKEVAKSRLRSRTKGWAEQLDDALRPTVHGQTNGIPIGPDTSFIIGELLLSSVDAEIRRRVPRARGFRFYDDFEFVTESRAEAEDVLGVIQDGLGRVDLLLNQRKTGIFELPEPVAQGTEWMRRFPPSGSLGMSGPDLIAFFDRVFELRARMPEASVVAFAMSRIPEISLWHDEVWELAQDLMAHGVSIDEGAMHQYVRALLRLHLDRRLALDTERLSELLDFLIRSHAPRGHASEVAWCIWAAMAFGIRLSSDAGHAISRMEDDVVALLAIEANGRGVFEATLDLSLWATWMVEHQLYGDHWLVAYEAFERGLLPSADGSDYIAADKDGFAWLRARGVRFTKRFRRPTRRTLDEIRPSGGDYDDGFDDDLSDF